MSAENESLRVTGQRKKFVFATSLPYMPVEHLFIEMEM
jgi:hypothetical protein